MPKVSLRLTDSELAELREWAYAGRRSLQKEIVWRLFSAESVGAAKVGVASGPREGVVVPADGSVGTLEPEVGERQSLLAFRREDRASRGCGADTPRGVKCKICGKVH